MRIGLYNRYEVHQISLDKYHGSYKVFGDSNEISIGSMSVTIVASADSIHVRTGDQYVGKFATFRFSSDVDSSIFKIKCLSPSIKEHTFDDDIEIKASKGHLKIINVIDMKDYLAGVIQSEGGGGRDLEYYKVQALISRTYALKNLQRHIKDGFNLCDATHCQAYHNRNTTGKTIRQSVYDTGEEIMVSKEGALIGTYFHASCGGQTSDASYVWNNSLSYCSPFVDTFCLKSRQANWTVRVSKWKWENYLKSHFGLDLNNKLVSENMYNFKQEVRKAFYIHPSLGIPLRDLRSEFELKSTYFDVSRDGNEVVIKGRGFGHGVGLCQEGAMSMAINGFSYRQIASFYFEGIRIMDYSEYLMYAEEIGNELH